MSPHLRVGLEAIGQRVQVGAVSVKLLLLGAAGLRPVPHAGKNADFLAHA